MHLKDTPATIRGMLSTVSSIFDPLDFVVLFILPGIGSKRHEIDQWFIGPTFLWKDTNEWTTSAKIPEVDSNNDPEI